MRRTAIAAIFIVCAASSAHTADISLSIPIKGKKTQDISDFKKVPTTHLLFRPLEDLAFTSSLYCSAGWLGAILHVGDSVIALDERANAAVKKKARAIVGGKTVEFITSESSKSPLKEAPEVVSKLVHRAERDCFEVKEKKVEPVAKSTATTGSTDSVESAYRICMAVDAADIASKPCEVDGWNSSIQVTLDVQSNEAKAICRHLADAARERSWRFRQGWKIEVFSPYSGGNSIAYCNL